MSLATAVPRESPAVWRTYAAGAAVLVALAPALLVALAFDGRAVDGVSPWIKPLKFAAALAIYLATLAFYSRFLPARSLSRAVRMFAGAVVAATLMEMAWLVSASAFGVRSHYNTAMPWAMLYPAAGVGAVLLTSASLVHGIGFLRDGASALPRALRLGLGLGLVATFALTLLTAGMGAQQAFRTIGTEPAGAPVWPLFGWSTSVGDIRPAHFLATHALHAVPLAALAALRLVPGAAAVVTFAAAAGWTGLTLLAFKQALDGIPFLYPLV